MWEFYQMLRFKNLTRCFSWEACHNFICPAGQRYSYTYMQHHNHMNTSCYLLYYFVLHLSQISILLDHLYSGHICIPLHTDKELLHHLPPRWHCRLHGNSTNTLAEIVACSVTLTFSTTITWVKDFLRVAWVRLSSYISYAQRSQG